MSYEGHYHYITKDGDHIVQDAYDVPPQDVAWFCAVDLTNGFEENNPSTHEPTLTVIAETDVWQVDHYGNKYAIKKTKYAPDFKSLNRWRQKI